MEPRRASGGCPLSPVQNLLATVSFGMASQTTLFSLLRRGQQIGVMAVLRLGFRYGERLTISRGNLVLAQVFGVLKHEMDGCMALSSFLALREYFLPEAWIPDWLEIPFWPNESRAAAVIGDQDAAAAVIGGQHGDLGMASQANHFSLLGKGLGIGLMAVVRLGFRYGEQLSMLRGYVVSARVFVVLKHEMDVSMALSTFLALGEYSFPEACIPFYSGMGSIWHLGHYIHYILGLLAAIRLATIFMEQQKLGVVAVIGGQDMAVAAIGGQDDHEIVNAH